MSTFRGRAPFGLITRETGNYAWIGENGEIIADGSHGLSDNAAFLHGVRPLPCSGEGSNAVRI